MCLSELEIESLTAHLAYLSPEVVACNLFVKVFPHYYIVILGFFTLLCCYCRRGPSGKFVPPVLNRNANDDDG